MALTTWRVLIKAMRHGGNLSVDEEYNSSGQHRDEPFIQYTTRIIHDQGGIRMSLSTYIRLCLLPKVKSSLQCGNFGSDHIWVGELAFMVESDLAKKNSQPAPSLSS